MEGISKLIVNPQGRISADKLIEEAIGISKINIDNLELEKFNEDVSIIIEYRNYQTHFNQKKEYDMKIILKEFQKAYIITRKLILFLLEPTLVDFPFPKSSGNEIDNFIPV